MQIKTIIAGIMIAGTLFGAPNKDAIKSDEWSEFVAARNVLRSDKTNAKALKDLNALLKNKDTHPYIVMGIHVQLMLSLFAAEDYEAAIAKAKWLVATYPADPVAQYQGRVMPGRIDRWQKRYTEAIPLLRQAIAVEDIAVVNYVQGAIWLADSLDKSGDTPGAIKVYQDALEQDLNARHTAGISNRLGDLLLKTGDKVEANRAWMQGIRLAVGELGAEKDDGPVWTLFNKLLPLHIETEEYRAFLDDVLRSCPAVKANAKFLGRVKSELSKL